MHRSNAAVLSVAALGGVTGARNMLARRRYRLEGKTVLITGSSRGLGLLMAHEFARLGARLVITARDPAELESAHDRLKREGADVLALPCDISDAAQVQALVGTAIDWFGRIDVLINNAGTILVGPMEALSAFDFEKAMDTHFWGPLHLTLAVLPEMRQRREGRIVNVSSIAGLLSVPHLLPYSASKHALTGLSEGLRTELAAEGIKVTTVCPGLMRTGSPRNAYFMGQYRAEHAWFSIAASLPFTSMNVGRAARRIVTACRRGEAFLVLSWQAKAVAILHALFPNATASLLGIVHRLLPAANTDATEYVAASEPKLGKDSASRFSPSILTALSDRAAKRNNQKSTTALRWAMSK